MNSQSLSWPESYIPSALAKQNQELLLGVHFAHMSKIDVVTNTPGIITTAVLGREVRGEVCPLRVGTEPWARVLTSRWEIC